jgi:hypothetical protein
MAKLPDTLGKFFWDCNLAELTWAQHRRFVAERLLNFGDDAALDWLRGQLTRADLAEFVRTSRRLDAKTRNYWAWALDDDTATRGAAGEATPAS